MYLERTLSAQGTFIERKIQAFQGGEDRIIKGRNTRDGVSFQDFARFAPFFET